MNSRLAKGLMLFINDMFDGNISACARILKISRSSIYRMLNDEAYSCSNKVIYSMIDYCYKYNKNYSKYIF